MDGYDRQVSNGVCADKSLVKATAHVMLTVQGTQDFLFKENMRAGLACLTDPTYRPGRLMQAPSYLLGKPLHDFDAMGNVESAILSRRSKMGHDQAYRFNMSKSLFMLEPLHPLRLFAIKIVTHQYFEFFVIFIILINCICLALNHPPEEADSRCSLNSTLMFSIVSNKFTEYWYYEEGNPVICGNSTSARTCPTNYTCLPDAGPNPDFGYSNFDHMGWSLVMSFQLLTMDFWENIYNKVLASSGIWCVFYFLGAIFFCSFYLLNLVLAVVALSYELEIKSVSKENERRKRANRTAMSYPADSDTLEHLHPLTTSVQVLIKTIHAIRTQKKIEEINFRIPEVPEPPSLLRLIGISTVTMIFQMFTVIFTVEMAVKLVALGPLYYIQGKWNIFDGIIVIISLVDTGLELADFRESSGTSVFRTFRLFRILKLAQSWKTMRRLLSTIANSVGPIGNITLILGLVIYIFALMGMKIFGKSYTPEAFGEDGVPRWNFNDFWHAFMMVFRVLCGEWIEPLWDCMRATSPGAAIPFFIPAVVIGNFIVLNLFLALLLNAFDNGDDDEEEEDNDQEGEEEKPLFKRILAKVTQTRKTAVFPISEPAYREDIDASSQEFQPFGKDKTAKTSVVSVMAASRSNSKGQESSRNAEVEDCYPECCVAPLTSCACCKNIRCGSWLLFRWRTRMLVEHRYFEWFILFTVLISSLVLVFEDVHLSSRPTLESALETLNYFFAFIFALEFVLKIIGLGMVGYFSSFWNCLDSLIVAISLVCVFQDQTLAFFRSLRTVRALRPLRAVSRLEGMKVVVNALFFAIPGIGNVLLVSLLFWLIFSILGVQLFAGKFYKCIEVESGDRVSAAIVPNKTECLKNPDEYRWINSNVNFDNVINGFLALFQVATFEGWMELMEDAVDCKEVDEQPDDESNLGAYVFFVIFIVLGSFFVLNLFVGVIIDNFNSLKRKYDELSCMGMLLTDAQRKWVDILKESAKKKPLDHSSRPKNKILKKIYDAVTSETFEIFILGIIMLNMSVMMWQHYGQSKAISDALQVFNWFFTLVFILEAVMKLAALRHHYFGKVWNIFDFVIVITSIIGLAMDELGGSSVVNPSLLRVFRVARVARLLRVLQFAKGIRQLLVALIISLPALLNVGTLLFLVIFIYAIIGMSTFGHVKKQKNLDETVNFETFGRSMMLLFRLSTGAGWNDILDSLTLREPDCDPTFGGYPNGNCGYPAGAVMYLVSYIFIVFLIIVNMYIAIILENVNRVQEGGLIITKEHLDSYYQKWAAFVTNGKQYLQVYQVSDFVDYLDEPLKIAKPNEHELVRIGINVRMGYRVQCFDLLRCLVKRLLEKHGESPQAFEEIASKLENHFRRRGVRKKSSISKSRSVSSVSNEVPNNGDCLLTMESFASSGPAIAEKCVLIIYHNDGM
ncbi:PREDICTED: sodium channel protein type 5 subunit alpha-like [Acropora digitifera]|uniref:sodium channel protein type 5 subunit alpha-like n=1 Tax=Acropora digitifera TaxID=70779 RepID=UPI00077A26DD|nr:PREDICTED: sodium channel protein type 5 subunit alpha-like [Acropora digitifera]